VETLDTYHNLRDSLGGVLQGDVIDVGSGGVISYPVEGITSLTLVDIASITPGPSLQDLQCPLTIKYSDAAALDLSSEVADCVHMQMLLHHLAEESFERSKERLDSAIREAYRVLRPGGKLVIVESGLPRWLEAVEKLLFRVTAAVLRKIDHPLVFQWSPQTVESACAAAGFKDIQRQPIARGSWMILLGRKWPTSLCPLFPYRLIAVKGA
jgi:SAM-dependent methyltransferase